MALSKQDQAFYEEKLNYKSIGYLFGATTILGAIMWPLTAFMMDYSTGAISTWNGKTVEGLMIMGFMLGTIVSVVMNFLFRFLLWMGWLPPRR